MLLWPFVHFAIFAVLLVSLLRHVIAAGSRSYVYVLMLYDE